MRCSFCYKGRWRNKATSPFFALWRKAATSVIQEELLLFRSWWLSYKMICATVDNEKTRLEVNIPLRLDLRFSCLVHLPALRGLVDGGSVAVSSSSIMTVTTEGDPSLTAGLAGPEKLISNWNDSSVSLSMSLTIVTRYVCKVSPGENLTIAGSSRNKNWRSQNY